MSGLAKSVPAKHTELTVEFGGHTSAGKKSENQDAFAALQTQGNEKTYKGIVAALADGCSSAKNAKDAAHLAVTHFISEYLNTPDSWAVGKSVSKVLSGLNQWMYSQSGHGSSLAGNHQADWLTTFSALILKSASGYIYHLGDTRVSRLREGYIEPLTRDHKVNQSLTKALGADLHLEIDAYKIEVKEDDIYLLTCDGVHDFVTKTQLKLILSIEKDLERAAKAVTNLALENGSDDNVSCLLVKIKSLPVKQLDEIYAELTRRKIPAVLKVGQSLDGYKVIREIHASPRSHIYLVQESPEHPPVVLKAPSLNFSDDINYLQGFLREGWAGLRLEHPNVMKVLDIASDSQFLYHICEYTDGQTLSAWQYDVPKPEISQVRSILEQIVLALRAFQRLDMVHRDLKLDNVMIDAHGQIKLIDYGTVAVASMQDNVEQLKDECPQGTANYTAPETLLEMKADFRSDLFSLAVIGYELLCGELPYKPQLNNRDIPTSYDHWRYRSIKYFRSDIPFWLDHALMKAVAPLPEQRYSSFSEFIVEISKPDDGPISDYKKRPLMERDPARFWQLVSVFLFVTLLVTLGFF